MSNLIVLAERKIWKWASQCTIYQWTSTSKDVGHIFNWVLEHIFKEAPHRCAWLAFFSCVNMWNDCHAWCVKSMKFLREFVKTKSFLRDFVKWPIFNLNFAILRENPNFPLTSLSHCVNAWKKKSAFCFPINQLQHAKRAGPCFKTEDTSLQFSFYDVHDVFKRTWRCDK